VLDCGRDGNRHFIVMELVPGCSLTTAMATPMHVGLVMQIIDQLLDALAHAHDAGLIHRDSSPTTSFSMATTRASSTSASRSAASSTVVRRDRPADR